MLKRILLGFAVVVLLLVLIVAIQPADYRVSRSATIDAPPAAVFPHVNGFHKWNAWSPWAKLDPSARNSFEGPGEGEGAIFKWSGNDQIGEGEMTLTKSKPNELVETRIHFVRPFEDTSTAEFVFAPKGEGTDVTWSMLGHKNFIAKAVCLFMDMDKMLGGDFEKGLASLKSVVEAEEKNGSAQSEGDQVSSPPAATHGKDEKPERE